ncbi:MAG: MFS transporter [Chloroflexi bacterium]|nr:MFS transporter [Chloroflexota bacterium]
MTSRQPDPNVPAGRHRPDSLWTPGRRPLTVGLVLTITLVAAEALAVSTAMPIVARELGGLELYGWVFSAFFLGSLIGITVVGGLIDERGVVLPFVIGLGLFAVGLLVAGLATSMPMVVVGRLIQGVGGGAVPPVAYVAIGRSLPERLRPRMFATLSGAWVVPGLIGPAIAGFVAETWHWRAVFLGLLPLIAIAGTLATRAMRSMPAVPEQPKLEEPTVRRGWTGRYLLAVATAVGTGILTTALLQPNAIVLVSMATLGLGIALPAFHRLTPAGTLRLARGFPTAVLLRGVLTFSFFTVDANITLLLQEVRGWSALAAGMALSAATVSWSAGAWYQSRHSHRIGPERFVRIGFPVVAVGMAGVALALLPEVPAWTAIPFFAVAGLGMGLSYSQFAIIVLRDAPLKGQGSATAAVTLSDALGTALGTGMAGALIAAGVRANAGAAPGLGAAIAMGVFVALLGFLAAPRLWRPQPSTALDTRESAATVR